MEGDRTCLLLLLRHRIRGHDGGHRRARQRRARSSGNRYGHGRRALQRADAARGLVREGCIQAFHTRRRPAGALAALPRLRRACAPEDALGDVEVAQFGHVVDRAQLALGQFREIGVCGAFCGRVSTRSLTHSLPGGAGAGTLGGEAYSCATLEASSAAAACPRPLLRARGPC